MFESNHSYVSDMPNGGMKETITVAFVSRVNGDMSVWLVLIYSKQTAIFI